MKNNVRLSKNTGEGTSQQKASLEMTATAIEHLNEELMDMAEIINKITLSSQFLCENAKILTEKAEQSVEDYEEDEIE